MSNKIRYGIQKSAVDNALRNMLSRWCSELTVLSTVAEVDHHADVSKDGLLQGSAIDTYQRIREELPELKLIASGGVTSMPELERLREIGCYGAIIGKAIYENKISLKDLMDFNS